MISRAEWCPCCKAQFLTPGLVVKHLVSVHSEYIMSFVDPVTPGGDPKVGFNCGFCGQHFPKRHHKLMMMHIDQVAWIHSLL